MRNSISGLLVLIVFITVMVLVMYSPFARTSSFWVFIAVMTILYFGYNALCLSQGWTSAEPDRARHHSRHPEAGANQQSARRVEDLEKRLAAMERTVAELRRENESLAEDYRFLQRVLDREDK